MRAGRTRMPGAAQTKTTRAGRCVRIDFRPQTYRTVLRPDVPHLSELRHDDLHLVVEREHELVYRDHGHTASTSCSRMTSPPGRSFGSSNGRYRTVRCVCFISDAHDFRFPGAYVSYSANPTTDNVPSSFTSGYVTRVPRPTAKLDAFVTSTTVIRIQKGSPSFHDLFRTRSHPPKTTTSAVGGGGEGETRCRPTTGAATTTVAARMNASIGTSS